MSTPDPSSSAPAGPPPGWYADPSAPAGRTGRRWWDGAAWSEHVVADPPPAGSSPGAFTPDGVPVAGMGARIGAYAIDRVVVGLVSTLLGLPFLLSVFRTYGDYVQRAFDAAESGTRPPGSISLYADVLGPLTALYAVMLVVTLLYHGGFLRWRGATPGKLAVGLRVRPRAEPGRLTWATVLRRLVGEHWFLAVALIPFAGVLVGLYPWADNLSALGNPQRRALHDRLADTVVVEARAEPHRLPAA